MHPHPQTWCGRGRQPISDDLVTGTFTARDPLDGVPGTTTQANPYHYTDNDPINRIDPLGLRSTDSDPAFSDPWLVEVLADLADAARTVSAIDLNAVQSSGRCSGMSLMFPVIQETSGVDLSGSACFLVDSKSYWVGATGGVGGTVGKNFKGVGSFSATGGHFYSNAASVQDLSGSSYCVSATANIIPLKYGAVGVSGELCLGLSGTPTPGDPFPFSGVWSISYGLSWGTPGVEAAGKISNSWVREVGSRRTRWVPFKGDIDLVCTAVNTSMQFSGGGPNHLPCVDPA